MRKFFHQISYTIKICTITALTGPLYGDAPYAANVMMLWPAGTRPSQQEQGHQQVDLNAHWQVQPHTQAHTCTQAGALPPPAQHDEVSPCWVSYLHHPPWQTLPRAFGQLLIRLISIHSLIFLVASFIQDDLHPAQGWQ